MITDDIRVGNRPAIKVTAQRELPSMKVTALRFTDSDIIMLICDVSVLEITTYL